MLDYKGSVHARSDRPSSLTFYLQLGLDSRWELRLLTTICQVWPGFREAHGFFVGCVVLPWYQHLDVRTVFDNHESAVIICLEYPHDFTFHATLEICHGPCRFDHMWPEFAKQSLLVLRVVLVQCLDCYLRRPVGYSCEGLSLAKSLSIFSLKTRHLSKVALS